MPIQVRCQGCDHEHVVADAQQGKKLRCKHCGTIFVAADNAAIKKARDGLKGPLKAASRAAPDEESGSARRTYQISRGLSPAVDESSRPTRRPG